MKRDLKALAEGDFDLLVIGGGATGASVAWDASLRGLKVALVEKGDFAQGTSSASSKLIHGGLRYLQNGEIGLVRESLAERRYWEANAPHFVFPLAFTLPTYKKLMRSKFVMGIALRLYDLLAFDKARLHDDDKKLPDTRFLKRDEAITHEPLLKREKLSGAAVYYDCQMRFPERMVLELLQGAAGEGAQIANYAEVTRLLKSDGKIAGATVEDKLTGDEIEIRAPIVINATGPWADFVMQLEDGVDGPARKLIRAKGIHVIVPEMTSNNQAIAAIGPKGHFFVLPWRGHTILGTTDTVDKGAPDDVRPFDEEIDDFLDMVNQGLEGVHLTRADVLHAYAGVRPLVDPGDSESSYKTSREAEVLDHGAEGGPRGLISGVGGKWTTSRVMAEEIVDLAIKLGGFTAKPCETHCTPLHGGEIGRYASFVKRKQKDHLALDPALVSHLCETYGSRMNDVADELINDAERQPICAARPNVAAEVRRAVADEMAHTLSDVVFRRTGIGTLGHPGHGALDRIATIMGDFLDWDDARQQEEITKTEAEFPIIPIEGSTI